MTTKRNEGRAGVDAFQQAWLNGLASVLASGLGLDATAVGAEMVKEAAEPAEAPEPPNGVAFRFSASGAATGECALVAPLAVCLRLAQIGGAAEAAEGELTAAGREAAANLLSRAAAAVTQATGIELAQASAEPAAWAPEARAEYRLTVPGQEAFLLTALIAPDLARGLAPAPGAADAGSGAETQSLAETPAPLPEAAASAADPEPNAGPAAAEPEPPEGAEEFPGQAMAKLGLLMDVPLDVTLRFGARQMILKDILELAPGGVIELDRGVQDPVELMVAGRVVATGEVVIVDGNYGLRVGEIASPRQRLSGLL